LLPYYRQEQASDRVQALLLAQAQPVLISHLTEVEVASALARWVRMVWLECKKGNELRSKQRTERWRCVIRSSRLRPPNPQASGRS
jgi:hypothetical protein